MRPIYESLRRHFWEVTDIRRQMYVSPLDREWWNVVIYYHFLQFAISHRIVRNDATVPGEIARFIRRPIRDWCLRSTIDWSRGYPRTRKTRV